MADKIGISKSVKFAVAGGSGRLPRNTSQDSPTTLVDNLATALKVFGDPLAEVPYPIHLLDV